MARALSSVAKASAFAPFTDEVWLALLEIDHTDLDTPIRVVNNNENVTHDSNTYTAYPFFISMPSETDERPPEVTLVIDNVSQTLTSTIRTLTSSPTVTLRIVLASAPDTILAGDYDFTLHHVTYNAIEIRGTLGFAKVLDEPFPGNSFTPEDYPGLF